MQYTKHIPTTKYFAELPIAAAPAIKRQAAQPIAQERYMLFFNPIFSTRRPLGICKSRAMNPVAPAISIFRDSSPPSRAT